MNHVPAKRPTGIAITAWLWIVIGGLMMLGALLAGLGSIMMSKMGGPRAPSLLFQYVWVLFLLQTIVAIVALVAGIALLRLRAWGRTTIVVLSWIGLVYTVGFGIFWVYMWFSMAGHAPAGSAPMDSDLFTWMGAIMGTIITALFAVPLGIMIRYLRGAEVRAAIANANQAKT